MRCIINIILNRQLRAAFFKKNLFDLDACFLSVCVFSDRPLSLIATFNRCTSGCTNQASQAGKAGCAGELSWLGGVRVVQSLDMGPQKLQNQSAWRREGEARRPEAVTSWCRLGFPAGSSCRTCKTSLRAQSNMPRALLRAHLSL